MQMMKRTILIVRIILRRLSMMSESVLYHDVLVLKEVICLGLAINFFDCGLLRILIIILHVTILLLCSHEKARADLIDRSG